MGFNYRKKKVKETSAIDIPTIGNPDIDNLQEFLDATQSAGLLSPGALIDNGDGTIQVPAGSVLIRPTNNDLDALYSHDFNEVTSLSLTDNVTNNIYLEYNGGSPQVIATTSRLTDVNTNILLGSCYREGTTVHINAEDDAYIGNGMRRTVARFKETRKFERVSGAVVGEVGTRNLSISSGVFWQGINRYTTSAFDSSVADDFTYVYSDGAGGFTEVTAQTQIDNLQYDDGSGTLATLTTNRYGVHFVYLEQDSDVYIMYGEGDYNGLANAEAATPPLSVPDRIASHSILIGKIIIQKSASSFAGIQSVWVEEFQTNPVTSHLNLTDIGVKTHATLDSEVDVNNAKVGLITGGAVGDVLIKVSASDYGVGWGQHNSLSGYIADEHINWTNASQGFKTTGTVTIGAGLAVISCANTNSMSFGPRRMYSIYGMRINRGSCDVLPIETYDSQLEGIVIGSRSDTGVSRGAWITAQYGHSSGTISQSSSGFNCFIYNDNGGSVSGSPQAGLYGVRNYAGNITGNSYGCRVSNLQNNAAGTMSNSMCFRAETQANSGAITTTMLFTGRDGFGSGTIGTQYGLHLEDLTKGSTNWAIYVDGTTQSRFGGNILMDSDSAQIKFGAGQDAGIYYDGNDLHIDAALVGSGTVILDNLPTSSAGLPTGGVWNNSNVLNIV